MRYVDKKGRFIEVEKWVFGYAAAINYKTHGAWWRPFKIREIGKSYCKKTIEDRLKKYAEKNNLKPIQKDQ